MSAPALAPARVDEAHRVIAGMTDDLAVVLEGACLNLGTSDPERFRACLARVTNWDIVFRAARWHKLDGLLFRALEAHAQDLVPEEAFTNLSRQFRANAVSALCLTSALAAVLHAFSDKGVPVLQVKGVSLAHMIHDELALRPALDLDLLVAPDTLEAAIEVLTGALGYQYSDPVNAGQSGIQRKVDYEVSLKNERALIDLHWSLSRYRSMFPFDLDKALHEPEHVTIGNLSVPTLPRVDLIPYLAFHGARHLWMKLFWIFDLAAFVTRHEDLDWREIMQRADELRQARALAHGLLLAERFFRITVPEAAREYAENDEMLPHLVDKTTRFLFDRDHAVEPYEVAVSNGDKLRWGAYMQTTLKGKIAVTARYLTHPGRADLEALPLPHPLFPIYYFVRPVRLLFRGLFR
jgi:hypothetical protein